MKIYDSAVVNHSTITVSNSFCFRLTLAQKQLDSTKCDKWLCHT